MPTTIPDGTLEQQPSEADQLLELQDPDDHYEFQDHSGTFLKLYAIVFFVNIASQILGPAQTQIYESIYCFQWYERHNITGIPVDGRIPEEYCKIAPVQTEISILKGWLEFFIAAPGLLLSVPMGILTDIIGRRYLAIANLMALSLTQVWATLVTWFGGTIPLRAIWFGAVLNIFTGGAVVAEMLFVVS